MHLRPAIVNRIANAGPGFILIVVGAAVFLEANLRIGAAGAAVSALGVVLLIRGFRMSVECRDGSLTVHGLLRSRAIARRAVTEVTDFPAIRWVDRSERRRWTPLLLL